MPPEERTRASGYLTRVTVCEWTLSVLRRLRANLSERGHAMRRDPLIDSEIDDDADQHVHRHAVQATRVETPLFDGKDGLPIESSAIE